MRASTSSDIAARIDWHRSSSVHDAYPNSLFAPNLRCVGRCGETLPRVTQSTRWVFKSRLSSRGFEVSRSRCVRNAIRCTFANDRPSLRCHSKNKHGPRHSCIPNNHTPRRDHPSHPIPPFMFLAPRHTRMLHSSQPASSSASSSSSSQSSPLSSPSSPPSSQSS